MTQLLTGSNRVAHEPVESAPALGSRVKLKPEPLTRGSKVPPEGMYALNSVERRAISAWPAEDACPNRKRTVSTIWIEGLLVKWPR